VLLLLVRVMRRMHAPSKARRRARNTSLFLKRFNRALDKLKRIDHDQQDKENKHSADKRDFHMFLFLIRKF
jgi:hypothetical protein